jgi:transposase
MCSARAGATGGRDRRAAILAGEADAGIRAERARGRRRAKLPQLRQARQLRQALEGRVTAQHRLLIRHVLAPVDFLEQPLAELTAEIEAQLAPLAEAVALLQTIPGVAEAAATTLVAAIGVDLSRFPSAKRLASWAGLCPGNKQRGGRRLSGRRLSGRTTSGKVWRRAVLGAVAWAITHPSGNYLAALDHRLARRRGKQQAIGALAHRLLVSIYHMLRDHQPYHDLGPGHFDRLDTTHIQRRYIHRLEQLGSAVTLTPAGGA